MLDAALVYKMSHVWNAACKLYRYSLVETKIYINSAIRMLRNGDAQQPFFCKNKDRMYAATVMLIKILIELHHFS